ncbi:MAG: nucleotidyltransferase domain-containing protein [Aggregatilineales bacterium]
MIIHDPERRAERDTLLARMVALLSADPRVCAAWLFGSLGRGDEDDLSDIDVWVIVDDEHAEAVKAARREFVTKIAEPLLIEEAPHNAPPDGAYLCVLYPGQSGPHAIDWYWQPHTVAQFPSGCRLLFDRVGIPAVPPEKPMSSNEHAAAVSERADFFWVMVNVAAKTIARRQSWAALGHITAIRFALGEVRWHVGISATRPDYKLVKRYADSPPMLPSDQLALVRRMAHEMEALLPNITALGGEARNAVVAPTLAFLDHVELLLKNVAAFSK